MNFKYFSSKFYFGMMLIPTLSFFAMSCSGAATLNETAFVVPERLKLKSSTAEASRVIGELKGGDRVTITGRTKAEDGTPWAKVKAPGVDSGWAEARHFVPEEIVEKSQRIADEIKNIQTQAIGKSKATLKLRLSPDRANDSNVATLLPSGTMLEIVGRERVPKPATLAGEGETEQATNKSTSGGSEIKYDDWYKVRLKGYSVLPGGWIYGGSVSLEIPPEIVYFVSTGRRITGWQSIGTIRGDDSKSGEHYLVFERKTYGANEQVDFDRVKVLAYDPASRNYSTPFREDVMGRFPITLKMEGTRGQFQMPVFDKNMQPQLLTYDIELLDKGKVKVTRPNKK